MNCINTVLSSGDTMDLLTDLKKNGKRFTGKKELVEILEGKHSTPRKMVLAKCYDCMGWYFDGAGDCKQINCPLYKMMPYRNGKKVKEVDE